VIALLANLVRNEDVFAANRRLLEVRDVDVLTITYRYFKFRPLCACTVTCHEGSRSDVGRVLVESSLVFQTNSIE
jgi:hypothetical protein